MGMIKRWKLIQYIINGRIVVFYNSIIKLRFINTKNYFCRRLRAVLFHNICYECRATFGKKNPERTFYIIRCPQAEMGLFAVINFVIYHLGRAMEMGAEPVVDWQHYPNKYFSDDSVMGKENAWEYFFYQTTDISLDEVYKSRNVILSNGEWEPDLSEILDYQRIEKNHLLVTKYIRLNEMMRDIYEAESQRIGIGEYKVLGVKCRGTDFVASKPKGHAIVPDVNMTISVIEEKMKIWGNFDKIYLSTEDNSILEEMKQYFGEKMYFTDGTSFNEVKTGTWLGDIYDKVPGKKKIEDMRIYLVATYILASCDALIAPMVGGTLGAVRIKGRYNKMHIFELGSY